MKVFKIARLVWRELNHSFIFIELQKDGSKFKKLTVYFRNLHKVYIDLRMTQWASSKQYSNSTAYSEIFSEYSELPFSKGKSIAYRKARYSEKRRDRTLDKRFEDFINNDHVSALKYIFWEIKEPLNKLEVTLNISGDAWEPTQCSPQTSRRERDLDTALNSSKLNFQILYPNFYIFILPKCITLSLVKVMKRRKQVTKNKVI